MKGLIVYHCRVCLGAGVRSNDIKVSPKLFKVGLLCKRLKPMLFL